LASQADVIARSSGRLASWDLWHLSEFTASRPELRANLLRLVTFLANEGSYRTAGLRAGDWITTGSWSGKEFASHGSAVEARFSTFGTVALNF